MSRAGLRAAANATAVLYSLMLAATATPAADGRYAVGVTQLEFVDPKDQRPLWMAVFYPASPTGQSAPAFPIPFVVNVNLLADAAIADEAKHPLIILSHGRGSDAWQYAWFAEALASHGYIVAGLNHFHANTYEREIAYLANKIWQRPKDISLAITFLLNDPFWSAHIDSERIAVSGHSQGGFTSLWIGGARVNAEKFLAFQRRFVDNKRIPERIRRELPLDAAPALDVHDKRVKAVFAMAPGIVQAFGMDPDGLRQLSVPAFLTVGAGDTETPPKENAEFAAQHIPDAQLWVIAGPVGHEIFTNECDDEGKDEFPGSCVDDAGVDRHVLHGQITDAALKFFGEKLGSP
jgi:predicted dienelactone hydrolase